MKTIVITLLSVTAAIVGVVLSILYRQRILASMEKKMAKNVKLQRMIGSMIKYRDKLGGVKLLENRFTHCISLGCSCLSGSIMKEKGWKKYSCPFDWVLSDPFIVRDCLENDFVDFLDQRQYIDNNSVSSKLKMVTAGHSKYGPKLFRHHNPREQQDHNYFKRCVERIKATFIEPSRKLLLQMVYLEDHTQAEKTLKQAKKLALTLEKLTDNYVFISIVCVARRGGEIIEVMDHTKGNKRFLLYRLDMAGSSNHVVFFKLKDRKLVDSILENLF